jgi:H+/Cl- antiporter ClcA
VAIVKSLASALSIGSGAAVGREGPIIQIGSALGSALGQIIKMPASSRIILVAAGAGAGIAATFNTPIGGVMFAIELMLPEVSVTSFLCAPRWQEAFLAGAAPQVFLRATEMSALQWCKLDDLKRFAVDLV